MPLHPENDFPCCAQTQPQTPSGETAPDAERGGEAPTATVERTGSRPAVHVGGCNAMCGDGAHFLAPATTHPRRLYIAGPISADPFDVAADQLSTAGYEAVPATGIEPSCGLTPEACVAQQKHVSASQGGGKHSWECYMKADLRELLTCDGVALLRGWQMSPGARIEFITATSVGIEARSVDEWIELRTDRAETTP